VRRRSGEWGGVRRSEEEEGILTLAGGIMAQKMDDMRSERR